MTTLWQDLRYGVRMLRKAPGFTAIALLTLAIGIGANTVMFSMSDLLLLRPRNVKNLAQLASCEIRDGDFWGVPYSGYLAIRDSHLAFDALMAQESGTRSVTLVHGDSARQASVLFVSANYFSFLGVVAAQGRGFLSEEEPEGGAPVVVLSQRLWQRLGADPKLVGEFVSVNGLRCQAVGVAPEGFTGVTLTGPDLWMPLGSYLPVIHLSRGLSRSASADLNYPGLHLVGRLGAGTSMAVAQAQLQALGPRFQAEYPRQWRSASSFYLHRPGRFLVNSDPGQERLVNILISLVLTAVSGIVLGIACLNLANMLLVQGAARHREIAVRMAIGGGRWRIVRQLLMESLLLALLAGVLGSLLAFWGTKVLNAWIAVINDPALRDFRPGLNLRVLAATLGLCLVATLLFGLRPALCLSRRDIAGQMKESGMAMLGPVRRRRGSLSTLCQTALAVVLVMSAALLTRSALQLARPSPQFDVRDKLVVQIDPLSAGYDRAAGAEVCETLADHLASLPDVKSVGMSPYFFFGGGGHMWLYEYLPGSPESGSRRQIAQRAAVTDVGREYFAALGIPLLQGRFFDRLDSAPNAEKVMIVDESVARKLRPDGNVLGCWVQSGFFTEYSDPYRVVGIVAHVPGIGEREVHAQAYRPAQPGQLSSWLYLRGADRRRTEALQLRVLQEIHRIDPRVPVLSVATLAQRQRDDSFACVAGFGARLAGAAGAAALFLASLGIYAVKGHMVASLTSEIGIRKALGATHGNIMVMVLREGLVLTLVGLLVGLVLGLGVARVSASMLYGVRPVDPVSLIVTVVLLGAASLLASYLPARRAARIDPMVALRHE